MHARTYSKEYEPSFYPSFPSLLSRRWIFMRITYVASCISACAAHFKRKIFSRLLINGLARERRQHIYARIISDPETLQKPTPKCGIACASPRCVHIARALQQAVIIMRDTVTLLENTGTVRKDLRLQLVCLVNCLSYRN